MSREPTDPVERMENAGPQTCSWVLASAVEPREVSWLWAGRLPAGMVSTLMGDGGLGKSLLTSNIAACVTQGEALLGEGKTAPADVIICNVEDPLAEVVVPRLRAARADLSRVHLLKEWVDGLPDIEALVRARGVRLVSDRT